MGGAIPGFGDHSVVWRLHRKGTFTVKSTYMLLNDGGLREYIISYVQRLRMPSKVKIFVWLASAKKLAFNGKKLGQNGVVRQLSLCALWRSD